MKMLGSRKEHLGRVMAVLCDATMGPFPLATFLKCSKLKGKGRILGFPVFSSSPCPLAVPSPGKHSLYHRS